MQSKGFAGFSCRVKFSNINSLHALSTIGVINPQTPYRHVGCVMRVTKMDKDIYPILFTCLASIWTGSTWVWLVFLNGATSLVKKAEESDNNPRKKIYGFVYTTPMIKLTATILFFGNIFAIYLSIAQYLRNHP
jgi:hypothetical protein